MWLCMGALQAYVLACRLAVPLPLAVLLAACMTCVCAFPLHASAMAAAAAGLLKLLRVELPATSSVSKRLTDLAEQYAQSKASAGKKPWDDGVTWQR